MHDLIKYTTVARALPSGGDTTLHLEIDAGRLPAYRSFVAPSSVWDITGYRGRPVPVRFFPASGPDATRNDGLAVLFPGLHYSLDGPVLFYAAEILGDAGFDLLGIDYRYGENSEFMQMPGPARERWITEDMTAVVATIRGRSGYSRYFAVAKSLGTLILPRLFRSATEHIAEPTWLFGPGTPVAWLTPILSNPDVRAAIRAPDRPHFVAIGTGDGEYDAGFLKELDAGEQKEHALLVVRDAGHSFEAPGNPLGSVDNLQKVLRALHDFVRAHGQRRR